MKDLLLVLLLATILTCTQSKILYSFSLMRHGATYPSSETAALKGKLTSVGLRQQYNLGTYLRQAYIEEGQMVNQTFNPNQVEFFCTSYSRTHNSAMAFAYGFYPLGKGWTIPPEVPADKLNPPYTPLFPSQLQTQSEEFALNRGFQPLPVRQLNYVLDNCPAYDHLLQQRRILISSQVESLEKEMRTYITKIATLFNLPSTQQNLQGMANLYETVIANLNLGRQLPPNFTDNDLKALKYMSDSLNTLTFSGSFARVLATPGLRMLRGHLQGAVNKMNLKLTFLFGHQSNLHPLLTLFNLTSAGCLAQQWKGQAVTQLNCVATPGYASSLLFELHENDGSHFVKVRYNGYYVNLCGVKSSECEFNAFVARVKGLETNFEQQCQTQSMSILIE